MQVSQILEQEYVQVHDQSTSYLPSNLQGSAILALLDKHLLFQTIPQPSSLYAFPESRRREC